MSKTFDSLFEDMTNEELEQWFKKQNIPYKKVEQGKGGVFINGVNIRDLDEFK